MKPEDAPIALHQLSDYLYRHYGNKVIILLDEYDTPMQEAYVNGYWEEMAVFTKALFNNTFTTNPYMERTIMTGITRVSKESLFSDLNNLKVVGIHGRMYELTLTNYETKLMFENLILDWFAEASSSYNGFIKSLLKGDLKAMNTYMNRVSQSMFSSFDGGNKPSDA